MDAIRSHKPPSPVAGCSKNKGDLWLEWKKPKIWQNVRIAPKQGGFMPKRGIDWKYTSGRAGN